MSEDAPIGDIRAAYDFRATLIPRADAWRGAAPLFHGWAIADAYLAGLEAGRKELREVIDAGKGHNAIVRLLLQHQALRRKGISP